MANQQRNGRNVAMPDENRPSWRPQDDTQRNRRTMSDDDYDDDRYMSHDRDRFEGHWSDRRDRDERSIERSGFAGPRSDAEWRRGDSIERYGQGQSGYGAGRYEDDRSYQSRNQGYPMGDDERPRERGMDERFSQGRGGGNWGERMEYPGRSDYERTGYGRGGDYERERTGDGRTDGRWGNEGYQRGMRGYGPWHGDHQEGGMYGHGLGSWGHQRTQMPSPYGPRGANAGMEMQDRYGSQGQPGRESHRGKGPSGYVRSDERIRELVCEALTDDHDIDATHIEITVKNGEVVLGGTVEDRRQKRMAEDCVEHVSGVKDVQNQIRIADKKSSGTSKETETPASPGSTDKRHRA
jgi:osmotically-inducible protein OsmY